MERLLILRDKDDWEGDIAGDCRGVDPENNKIVIHLKILYSNILD